MQGGWKLTFPVSEQWSVPLRRFLSSVSHISLLLMLPVSSPPLSFLSLGRRRRDMNPWLSLNRIPSDSEHQGAKALAGDLLLPGPGLMVFNCHRRQVSTDIPSAIGGDHSLQGLSNSLLLSFPLRLFFPCQFPLMYFQSPERKKDCVKEQSVDYSANYGNGGIFVRQGKSKNRIRRTGRRT